MFLFYVQYLLKIKFDLFLRKNISFAERRFRGSRPIILISVTEKLSALLPKM
jgi:hypothetical protein